MAHKNDDTGFTAALESQINDRETKSEDSEDTVHDAVDKQINEKETEADS